MLLLLAHIVVTSLADGVHGELLATSYLNVLMKMSTKTETEDEEDEDESGAVLLDLIVLLALSSPQQQQQQLESLVDRIVDSWLSSDRFPFDLLDGLLHMLFDDDGRRKGPSLLVQRLTPALLRWAVFLLLAPARNTTLTSSSMDTIVPAVHAYVLNLHHRLDRDRQAELVHSLLHLSEETALQGWVVAQQQQQQRREKHSLFRGGSRKKRKRRPEEPNNSTAVAAQQQHRLVHQSVNQVLKQLAETAPNTLLRFQHILTRRLTSTTTHFYDCNEDLESVRELCSILSSLVESSPNDHHHHHHRAGGSGGGMDSSELMMLLQKLLFSSSGTFGGSSSVGGGVKGDSGRIVRGILLATELLGCSLRKSDKDCIKDWVLRLLLPSTRRMVDPELGTPGLAFLNKWIHHEGDDEESKKGIFQHFKMILANTGLIQILENYHKSKSDETVLGYSDPPVEFQLAASSSTGKTRNMVFCVGFFLRHTDMSNPARWRHATQWVFDLVDAYLQMGREKAATWRPDGWLLASVEFPAIVLPLDTSVKKQKALCDWIEANLFYFDLSRGIQRAEHIPLEYADIIVTSLDTKHLRQFQVSLLQFALSLLIGISLSTAVLKNTFEHWKASQQKSGTGNSHQSDRNGIGLLELMKLQIIKIYDLRTKSMQVDFLLCSLKTAIRRSVSSRMKDATVGLSEEGESEQSESIPSSVYFSVEVRDLFVFCCLLPSTSFF